LGIRLGVPTPLNRSRSSNIAHEGLLVHVDEADEDSKAGHPDRHVLHMAHQQLRLAQSLGRSSTANLVVSV
jgi:hypothetical protein